MPQQAMLQQLAAIVSALNATLDNGFLQEQATIQRMLDG
jgi:hypothetical protein